MLLRSRHRRISHAAVTARLWTLPRGSATAANSNREYSDMVQCHAGPPGTNCITLGQSPDTYWSSQSLSRHLGTFSGSCSLTLKHLRSILGRHIRIQDGQTHLDFDFRKLCRSLHRLRWIRLSSTFRKMKISCFDRLGIDLVDTIVT